MKLKEIRIFILKKNLNEVFKNISILYNDLVAKKKTQLDYFSNSIYILGDVSS